MRSVTESTTSTLTLASLAWDGQCCLAKHTEAAFTILCIIQRIPLPKRNMETSSKKEEHKAVQIKGGDKVPCTLCNQQLDAELIYIKLQVTDVKFKEVMISPKIQSSNPTLNFTAKTNLSKNQVGFICLFVVSDPTYLGATIVVAQALCLTIFNLSPTQKTWLLPMVIKLVCESCGGGPGGCSWMGSLLCMHRAADFGPGPEPGLRRRRRCRLRQGPAQGRLTSFSRVALHTPSGGAKVGTDLV